MADEEAQHKTDNVKHFKQIDKLEIALKAGRNAQEKLRSELAASKGETSSASRKLAAAEAAIQKTLEEQKSWRTDKYALEDRIAQADEKRLEAEKELIKVRGEMQNYHNEYLNTKKLLGMSRMVSATGLRRPCSAAFYAPLVVETGAGGGRTDCPACSVNQQASIQAGYRTTKGSFPWLRFAPMNLFRCWCFRALATF